jgi:hypothetical protein
MEKFVNTLRLRMAINMDAVDHTYATTQVLEAISDGIISSSTDSAYLNYASVQPNT